MANFSSKNEGTWFWFDEDNHDEGGVCLRELSGDEYEKIERMTVKTKKKIKRGVAFDAVTVDEKLASRMRWDYCIVNWKNLQVDSVDIECTVENKVKMVNITNFIKFIGPAIEELSETNEAIDEARLGNLKSTSDGSGTDQTQ